MNDDPRKSLREFVDWSGTSEMTPPPVLPVDRVEVVFRNGVLAQGAAELFDWKHAKESCECWDIIKWRRI